MFSGWAWLIARDVLAKALRADMIACSTSDNDGNGKRVATEALHGVLELFG